MHITLFCDRNHICRLSHFQPNLEDLFHGLLLSEIRSCVLQRLRKISQVLLEWTAEFGGYGNVERTTYGDNISMWIDAGNRLLGTVAAYNFNRL